MPNTPVKRLSKVAREFNVGISTIVGFLASQNIEIDPKPNTKIDSEVYQLLVNEFGEAKAEKEEAKLAGQQQGTRETITIADTFKDSNKEQTRNEEEVVIKDPSYNLVDSKPENDIKISVVGKIDLKKKKTPKKEDSTSDITPPKENNSIDENAPDNNTTDKTEVSIQEKKTTTAEIETIKLVPKKLIGPTVVGKIDLPEKQKAKPVNHEEFRRKRKRIKKVNVEKEGKKEKIKSKELKKSPKKVDVSDAAIQKEIKETLAKLSGTGKSKSVKHRREKRLEIADKKLQDDIKAEEEESILKVTEFVTVSEIASMMNASVNDVIAACMSLGIFASINQRLDAETLALIAEEFGFTLEFVSAEVHDIVNEVDDPNSLLPRPPIVTVMGHVDHGKTSLLDKIRKENVIAGEAGGITQHIGAYRVKLDSGKEITFLDTPGHEAFTAMRARGAQVTDLTIIIIAADDSVMPQTIEAINHAQAAGVPMVFAINKIDKPGANVEKIKEELSKMNLLVEDWGGKYQCQEISAKQGIGIEELLEKVLLEAEMLDITANPNKKAVGTVIESSLDKGKGYVTNLLVSGGTLHVGDIILAGKFYGKVKAMQNERGQIITEAGPAMPVVMIGLNGASTAGDKFNVFNDEKEAKQIASKREQLQREQGLRTQKHITLDEIGRRLAIGGFKELNLIVKGDVDGSVEALSDALLKLSTEKIQVNVIHKGVGQISESDVLLASASDAIIVGFQVRPSAISRKLAETEEIDIRLYSVIYKAIEEIKDAMEGLLSPVVHQKIIGTAEIREVFKITKVGTIAGCFVIEGKIIRNNRVRVIRDGIVVYTGDLGSLKHFKEDVKEMKNGNECGLNIEKFNDIKVADVIESFEEYEEKDTL